MTDVALVEESSRSCFHIHLVRATVEILTVNVVEFLVVPWYDIVVPLRCSSRCSRHSRQSQKSDDHAVVPAVAVAASE